MSMKQIFVATTRITGVCHSCRRFITGPAHLRSMSLCVSCANAAASAVAGLCARLRKNRRQRVATDAWKQLSDTLDVTRAYDLLDAAQVRIKRVPAVVIPTGRDSPEIRECLDRSV